MIKLTSILETQENPHTYSNDRDIGTGQEMTSIHKDIQEFGDAVEKKMTDIAEREDVTGNKISTEQEAQIKTIKEFIINTLSRQGWKRTRDTDFA